MAVKTAPPSGMRDFPPGELLRRHWVEGIIREVYASYGFVPLETPSIENLTTLLGKYGDEGDQLLFRILHRRDKLARALETPEVGEKDLADLGLRYDLTVPLARFLANNRNDLPRFFKRFQIQPVWRADRPGKGRYREFLQCDVDCTGTTSLLAEAEVCGALAQVFHRVGLNDFRIHINHRRLLRCLIIAAGLDAAQEGTALVAVDKLDKIGADGVLRELSERGISPGQGNHLMSMITRPEGLSEEQELGRLKTLLADNTDASECLDQIRELLELLAATPAANHTDLDASLARGLGYYTGPIFEIRMPGLSGSLGGGGRYDGLIGMFLGQPVPAVGFSIGFERLVLVLEERHLFPAHLRSGPDILLCRFPDVSAAQALQEAHFLRRLGFRTEIFPETPKVGKQIGYAETIGATFVVLLGAAEMAEGALTVKHLATGRQETIPRDRVDATLRGWLDT